MSNTNDFVPFCNENTGTNLPTQSAYLANPNLPLGNQPGIASSSLNNKAIRQGSTMAAVLAQFVSDQMAVDMLDNQNSSDHAIPPALYAALTGALKRMSPVITSYTSGSGNHNLTYKFLIASGSATVGATYSDGTTTYTVTSTISSGTELKATGGATPAATAGPLTKLTGTGDATITYYAYRKPLYVRVRAVGGGGGGGGGGSVAGTAGGDGGNTTFDTCTAGKGLGGTSFAGGGGANGTVTVGSGWTDNGSAAGQVGGGGPVNNGSASQFAGAPGGSSFFGSGGPSANFSGSGGSSTVKGGGGGGGCANGNTSGRGGCGGGSGAYLDAINTSPASTFAYSVGTGGSAGNAGTNGFNGGGGGNGIIFVEEHYQ